MTTIAYKNGVIAYDSLAVGSGTVLDRDFNKRITRDGVNFFFCGSVCLFGEFLDAWFSGENVTSSDLSAIVYGGKILFYVTIDEDGTIQKEPVELSKIMSIGSGSDHALTAMDCGLSAKEAVKMAALRDTSTGGRIRTFSLKA